MLLSFCVLLIVDPLSYDITAITGAEAFIMRNFPLDEYRIKIITAERLRGEIREYLKLHGFEFVTRLTRWGGMWCELDVFCFVTMSSLVCI